MRRALTPFLLALAPPAGAFELALPLDCRLGDSCYIQQFPDHDPGPGATDFTCGPLSYDGHDGTDIALPSRAAMAAGVAVLAAAPGVVKGVRDGVEDFIAAIPGKESGNGVVIDHGDGWETQYCHLRRGSVRVKAGERVAAGQALGFVIVSDGFSTTGRLYNGTRIGGVKDNASPKWIFYTLRGLNPEAAGAQNLNVHTIMLKDLSDASPGYQRVVIGFEDINRESGGDHDFNDVVLAVHVTPRRAIANLDTLQTLVAATDADTDGDGVKDALDEFPADPGAAFSSYYPGSSTWGTLAFEDQWPRRGDYDMNDVVMGYRTREIMNAARQVTALSIDYRLLARGGLSDSGFGVHLPGLPASAVAGATLAVDGGPPQVVGVEPGQAEATFIVTPSVQAHLPVGTDAGCPFANTQAGCPTVAAVSFTLTLNFTAPQAASRFASPYNPFIYRSSDRGREVHLPGRAATTLADRTRFGSEDDRTPASGTGSGSYLDAQRRPWALDIPAPWSPPLEVTDLMQPYPRFSEWAQSAGSSARDWYLSGTRPQFMAPQRP